MTNATSYDIYASSAEDLSRVRERLFARTMDRVFAAHPYYRQVFKEAGISREDIGSLDDLKKLPITTKTDFMAAPHKFCMGPEGALDDYETIGYRPLTVWFNRCSRAAAVSLNPARNIASKLSQYGASCVPVL